MIIFRGSRQNLCIIMHTCQHFAFSKLEFLFLYFTVTYVVNAVFGAWVCTLCVYIRVCTCIGGLVYNACGMFKVHSYLLLLRLAGCLPLYTACTTIIIVLFQVRHHSRLEYMYLWILYIDLYIPWSFIHLAQTIIIEKLTRLQACLSPIIWHDITLI